MALKKIPFQSGFNKQATSTQAEGQWQDGDNVRFRYGSPEKIGGWSQQTANEVAGVARAIHTWSDLDGVKYTVIGTDKTLTLVTGGAFYDITPLKATVATCTFTTTTGNNTVTINKVNHGLEAGYLLLFSNVTIPGSGTSYTSADFTTNTFEVQSATADTFTVKMTSNESDSGVTAGGNVDLKPYENIGPAFQTPAYGFGTGTYGGRINTGLTTTLDGALLNDTAGTGGVGTSITLTSTSGFPTSGTIQVDNELITYSAISVNDLTGITRAAKGTSTAAHLDGAIVRDTTNFMAWNEPSSASEVTIDPGRWSLDNYGQILIANIHNGKTFQWDPSVAGALAIRATQITNAPTAAVNVLVSDRDRHLIFLGTETTIGTPSTQDKMFIRFSDQENLNEYTPTSTNTAGTFQLDQGTEIVGAVQAKDYTLILTDRAAYVMQFVGPPFTFSIRQVGSDCGLMGQKAIVYSNGAVFWMANSGGFYVFDGTVKNLPCLVEDFVFDTQGSDLGINIESGSQIVTAGHNSLFSEVTWFYPSKNSPQINRCVTFNYAENVWTTGSLARTAFISAGVFALPQATQYLSSRTPTFPTINGASASASILYSHETGTDQVRLYSTGSTTSAINSSIESGDFDLDIDGDGEYFLSMSRFIPDFKYLNSTCNVTILLRRYPNETQVSSQLGPFTINSSTDKVNTRARSRLAAIKIEADQVSNNWKFGLFRFDAKPDGRR
jgi:hypothetical protein